jgi:hypothetical protein
MSWVLDGDRIQLSKCVMDFVLEGVFGILFPLQLDYVDANILSLVSNINFRYLSAASVYQIARICRLVSLFPTLCFFSC